MALTRTIWKNSFTVKSVPRFPCPVCQIGFLTASESDFQIVESEKSKSWHTDDSWDPICIVGSFSVKLTCENSHCMESTFLIGKMDVDQEPYFDEYDQYSGQDYVTYLSPLFFFPGIPILDIDPNVPAEVKKLIDESYQTYWVDLAACANKIRMVIESIISNQRISQYVKNQKQKRQILPLHQRITEFGIKKPKEANLLMAIKWIGNSGSHLGDNLVKNN